MTTITIDQRTRSPRERAPQRPTMIGPLLAELREHHAYALGIQWPNPKYQRDPAAFAREIMGVEPWSRQDEILEAVRDHDRVSVASGHKIGKSNTAGLIAYWFFTGYRDARVVMSSTTARQVDEILWREIRKMRARSGRCVACAKREAMRAEAERRAAPGPVPCPHSALIDGKLGELARTGLRAADMREIVGFTAREAEAVAGVSGENLLYIIDEASGVPDEIFEAIEGNRAGGAKVVLFGNPTRTEGEFYESHHDKRLRQDAAGRTVGFYKTLQVSSEETPNVVTGRKVIPGLATRDWVEEKKREWGEDSALYKVRVKGVFVRNEDGKVVSVHAIHVAEQRWLDACDERGQLRFSPTDGRLHIGLDPAGPGDAGDETAYAVRRGSKVLRLYPFTGLTEDAIVVQLLGILKTHRVAREPLPVVTLDREGPIGAAVYGRLRDLAERERNPAKKFDVVGVRASDRAVVDPQLYDRLRDELWARLAEWFREGGALPEDTRLAKELHGPSWFQPLGTARLKVTSKKELRKLLGHSPDRADAVALAVWEATVHADDEDESEESERAPASYEAEPLAIDPYGGSGHFDPYGGAS